MPPGGVILHPRVIARIPVRGGLGDRWWISARAECRNEPPTLAFLVVAERFVHKPDTFAVVDGVAQAGNFQTSAGMQPFAFDVSPEGFLVVAEVLYSLSGSPRTIQAFAIHADGELTPMAPLPDVAVTAVGLAAR